MLREWEQNTQPVQATVSSQAPVREDPPLSESTKQETLALFFSLKRYFYTAGAL